MGITREPLKSLLIDVENGRYELNGKPMEGISRLDIDFDNGKWTLLITRDEFYQTAPKEEGIIDKK